MSPANESTSHSGFSPLPRPSAPFVGRIWSAFQGGDAMSEVSTAKILIVDDNEIVLEVLRLTLERAGFAVTAISSAPT